MSTFVGNKKNSASVYILDMGEPVRIMDLAEQLIEFYGQHDKEGAENSSKIDIQVIGLRPGEKLTEELLIGDAVVGTRHPKIMQADEFCPSDDSLRNFLKFIENLDSSTSSDDLMEAYKRHFSS